jgi:hypothetical protein
VNLTREQFKKLEESKEIIQALEFIKKNAKDRYQKIIIVNFVLIFFGICSGIIVIMNISNSTYVWIMQIGIWLFMMLFSINALIGYVLKIKNRELKESLKEYKNYPRYMKNKSLDYYVNDLIIIKNSSINPKKLYRIIDINYLIGMMVILNISSNKEQIIDIYGNENFEVING